MKITFQPPFLVIKYEHSMCMSSMEVLDPHQKASNDVGTPLYYN